MIALLLEGNRIARVTITSIVPSFDRTELSIITSSINEEATVQCRIDGRHMGSSMTQRHGSSSRFGVRVSPTQRLPYVFSDLVLVGESFMPDIRIAL